MFERIKDVIGTNYEKDRPDMINKRIRNLEEGDIVHLVVEGKFKGDSIFDYTVINGKTHSVIANCEVKYKDTSVDGATTRFWTEAGEKVKVDTFRDPRLVSHDAEYKDNRGKLRAIIINPLD